MKHISRQAFPYTFDPEACEKCGGNCCVGESGYIWVSSHEITTIACLLGLNPVDFMQKYLIRVGNRLSIAERTDGSQNICVFFDVDERRCTIYTARPNQCRCFPFWEYYLEQTDELLKECPGVRLNRQDDSKV